MHTNLASQPERAGLNAEPNLAAFQKLPCIVCGALIQKRKGRGKRVRKTCSAQCYLASIRPPGAPLLDRLLAKVTVGATEDDCWRWNGSRCPAGYGQIGFEGKLITTNRASWIAHFGNIPGRQHVLHRCDNPECCNPKHLFLGTRSDNMIDMYAKRRRSQRHERNGHAKLTDDDVRAIKALPGVSAAQLASDYGVSPDCISNIRRGATWAGL